MRLIETAQVLTTLLVVTSGSLGAQDARPASVVQVRPTDEGGWQLVRNGRPYVIQGVGGSQGLDRLAAAGGNSIRTWSADGLSSILDTAHQHGLTVTVGVWLGHERHGFDYTNADQVAAQSEAVAEVVRRFRDHPAVLMWALGNEMEGYGAGDNAAIWSAVNSLAALVKRIDPHHPTMTVVAEIGGARVQNIHRLCPEIDVIGINSYGGAATLPARYRAAGGKRPYVLTEFGPPGSWEVTKTTWGAAPEPTSTEKARSYEATYRANVQQNGGQCLGSYAFLWGNKQEATSTWFGLLLPDGSRTAGVDALQELWTGRPPANRCPVIAALTVDGPEKRKPRSTITAKLVTSDPEQDKLRVEWLLQAEAQELGVGGDAEAVPPKFPDAIISGTADGAEIRLPEGGGGYRLFVTVRDGQGGAAVANVPLYVDAPIKVPDAPVAAVPFVIYDDAGRDRPPYVPTGWMGNTKQMKLDEACETQPHQGKTCLKFQYLANEGWGGIVWQSPPHDWGDKAGGWNLKSAKRVRFWARGDQGGEVASFQMGLLRDGKKFPDSGHAELKDVKLTTEWQSFEMDLKGQSLQRIKTGFAVTVASSGKPLSIYLDDIEYIE